MAIAIEEIIKTELKTYREELGLSNEEFNKKYSTKGVHFGSAPPNYETADNLIFKFAAQVPLDAIKVVDFDINPGRNYIHMYGLAVIPKKGDNYVSGRIEE